MDIKKVDNLKDKKNIELIVKKLYYQMLKVESTPIVNKSYPKERKM